MAVFSLSVTTPLSADEQQEGGFLLEQTRAAVNHIKPFRLRFTQQVFSDQNLDIEESGEIFFLDQNNLKWTYKKPEFKVFLLKNDEYRFYDEENEQLRIGLAREGKGQWFWNIFFNDEMASCVRGNKKQRILKIKKDDANEPMDIEIHLTERFLPEKVIQTDIQLKIKMIFYFSEYKENVAASPQELILTVPDGVEIVDGRKE